MNFFRAKQKMKYDVFVIGSAEVGESISKGQLFYVDASSELPVGNKTPEELKEHWEELMLNNNYGTIRLIPRV